MPNAARMSDLWTGICCCHSDPTCISMSGMIITGSSNVISSGQGQATLGDITIGYCGHTGIIITGSPNMVANNKANAGVGGQITGCNIGTIITGNPTHIIS